MFNSNIGDENILEFKFSLIFITIITVKPCNINALFITRPICFLPFLGRIKVRSLSDSHKQVNDWDIVVWNVSELYHVCEMDSVFSR